MTVRTILLRLLFAVVVLFLLIAAFHAIENWRGERAWQDYVTAARGRGAKLYATEFQVPPIPPEQNYAAIPVFEEVFAASEAGKSPPAVITFPDRKSVPRRNEGIIGERTNLEAWRDYLLKSGLLDTAGENVAADVLRGLEKFEPVLQQIRNAGTRPASRFPVKWERGFETPEPHLGLIHQISRSFSLRTSAHLTQGNSAAAYAEFQHGLRLYRALEHEPTLFSGLLRMAVLSDLLQSVWEGLSGNQWAEAELRGLVADLSALRIVDDLRFCLDSERSAFNVQMDLFAQMSRRGLIGRFATNSSNSGPEKAHATALRFALGYPRGWFRQNQLLMNDIHDVALDRINTIQHRGLASALKDDRMESLEKTSRPHQWYYAFAILIMHSTPNAEFRFFTVEARVQQAITACALERYQLANGRYPAKLEELVPKYLDKVPRDILANIPMRYRLTPEGRYEMWAVGTNATDDDAKVSLKKSAQNQPDWVWHYRNPPETKPRKAADP